MLKYLIKKWKYLLAVLGLSVGIAYAAQVNPPIPDITLERMQIAYDNAPQIKAKYKMEQASFIQEAIDENAIQIEIGDKTKDKFSEELNIKKWDNEVSLKIKHKTNEKKNLELDGDKIKMKGDKTEMHFYEVENGYEYEIILLEKPDNNLIEFDIEIKGLNFYYQPALNLEDNPEADYCTDTTCFKEIDGQMATTTHRPENVVGSYAVYHESKAGDYHKMDGKNYMAGKAFHIYRPKITDAEGNWTWEEMNIDIETGILTITIPQEFLDNAVYPVSSKGLTFGYDPESHGQSSTGFIANAILTDFINRLGGSGTGNSMSAYCFTAGPGMFQLGLYRNSDDVLIGNTDDITEYTTGWQTGVFVSEPELSAINYNLAFMHNNVSTSYFKIYYDTGGNTSSQIEYSTYGTWTNPVTWGGSGYGYIFSIYCTYTAGGAEDTCIYSSGNWDILYSDNCYINTNTYVAGDFNLIYDGAGSFGLAAVIGCDDLNIGTGAEIQMLNGTAEFAIY